VRAFTDFRDVKPGASRSVLSFLVTFFFTRVKKKVTRSSAGGVEALLEDQRKAKKDLERPGCPAPLLRV
jgi:hypothetical protein